ncbi:efflux RND transporter permease subunit [Shimia sp. MIT1388]|uniref:efflux RND transporter permease subunit n=1 Tax=Shimia sp. MIT1388 TaxID=3096992 RepID=UPI00399BB470
MPYALVVIVVALMIQFNSCRRVVIIMLCAPLVIVGVPLALFVTGHPLSFFGMLGLIALSGIIVNNAILMVDQIDRERGVLDLREAIVAGAQKRFRPIVLTSLTTVVGLVPMAAFGGTLWEPMAALMLGGLGVASVFALFVVPWLYHLLLK